MRRDTQVVSVIAIFVVLVGFVAAVIIANNESGSVVQESMWFRIISDNNETSTLASIYLYDEDGKELESFLFLDDGVWQESSKEYLMGTILCVMIYLWDSGNFIDVDYRVGRGPMSITEGSLNIELISYWEMPNY
jgi:hypothetical protein